MSGKLRNLSMVSIQRKTAGVSPPLFFLYSRSRLFQPAEIQPRLHRPVLSPEIAGQGRQLHAVSAREGLFSEFLAIGGGAATAFGESL
ncbi:hypothetical protein A7X66_18905 [Stenotrophomonas maltophilia]|nr:hypothetical protein A7X66_18905 [Stenotrophomonas maltophilia]